MLYCPNCGTDRRTVPPVDACPACGAAGIEGSSRPPAPPRAVTTPSEPSIAPVSAPAPQGRNPLAISAPIAVLAILFFGGGIAIWAYTKADANNDSDYASYSSGSILNPRPQPKVVVDEFKTLKDGEGITWKLPAGSYEIEMTATSDGASVKWVGADCEVAQEVPSYSTVCHLSKTGQMTVVNPTTFGMGPDVTVTVNVVRMP